MNLVEKEVTRWELPSVDIANVYRADRNDHIQLWWTPVEELKAFALNVFSPRDHILWNVNTYRAFEGGAFAYTQRLLQNESMAGILNSVIRDTGAELRSDIAYELLGGFTRAFGDRYEPHHSSQPAFLSYPRHRSIAVPESCQPLVSRYFQEQARVFGESASRECPEEISLYYDGDSNPALSGLFCDNVLMMPEARRNAQLALIRSDVDILAQGNPEHFAFTGNAIGISTAGIEYNAAALGDFAEIARFRVETAIRHYSLRGVEKLLRFDLAHKDWGVLSLADLRDELRGRLNTKLVAYPVIESNPFELEER